MRRALAAILLLCLTVCPLAAISPRLESMGGIGIAAAGADMQSYVNPAAVFFDQNRHTLAIHTGVDDFLGVDNLPYLPSSETSVLFVADMVTLGLDLGFVAENQREDVDHVDLYQSTAINVNFSAGYSFISAGIGVSGGSLRQRLDVEMDSLFDFPVQALLSPFDRVVNSEYIQVNAGLMAKAGNFHIGMLMANILGKEGTNTVLTWDTLFGQTGFGVYWSRDEYAKRGKLHNFVYSFGVDVDYVFTENRRLNMGGEVEFRLVRDSGIFLRAGYSALLSDFSSGVITVGLGASLRRVEASLNAEIPKTGVVLVKAAMSFLF